MNRLSSALLLLIFLPFCSFAAEKPLPRILLAVYDGRVEENQRTTSTHSFLEMPANHLGYDIHYHDIMTPLPTLDDNVAGVILWFTPGTDEVPDVKAYIAWLKNVVLLHKKLIIIENPGVQAANIKDPELQQAWNYILGYIGLQDDTGWNQLTYNTSITYIDNKMLGFERKMAPPFPSVSGFHLLAGSDAISHLRMHVSDTTQDNNFDMVVTSKNGGFIATGYADYTTSKTRNGKTKFTRFWFINPFMFLQQSLDIGIMPVPDNTTMNGKRIFYSHIDGDGWNNISEIEKYNESNSMSSDVIYNEILKPYREFAFSVGIITEDIDKNCFAMPESENIARKILALPNVEPASHTYSHPIYWAFFANYTPEKERPLLKYYPPKPEVTFSAVKTLKRHIFGATTDWTEESGKDTQKHTRHDDVDNYIKMATPDPNKHNHKYKTEKEILTEIDYMPRSYACSPFDLEQEIYGSLEAVRKLAPPGKKVNLIQWPGDTAPFEEAIAKTRKAGALNINGGDSRFDAEFPSYSFVAPIGIQIGNERQIFSSNSNEETYTDDWTDRFYGYRYLPITAKNTETPIRVSPLNIYFHMFSGQKEASLNALKENLNFALTQNIIPVTAGEYASVADGFYTSIITPDGYLSWHISDRGNLETIRFDNADNLSVNFESSHGILGQNLYQHSLYVSLDPQSKDVYLSINKTKIHPPKNNSGIYLMESSWKINNLRHTENGVEFFANGYGKGNMKWQAKASQRYIVSIKTGHHISQYHAISNNKGLINITVTQPSKTAEQAIISITGSGT